MTIKLGDFFPKKSVNETSLALDDPRWKELEGGYKGTPHDVSPLLLRLEGADTSQEINDIYLELWNELHHQGDVGIASYYSVPHLVRIAKQKGIVDYNVLALVSLIEIQRHKENPKIPKALEPLYMVAIKDLEGLAKIAMKQPWNLDLANAALTAIALAKNQIKLAEAILNLDSDDRIDEFLETC